MLRHSAFNRGINLLLGLGGLLFLAPLMLLVALWVYATTGRMLFRRPQIGSQGRVYWAYSFQALSAFKDRKVEFQRHDRNTPWNRFDILLGSLGLYELPQVLNVIKGDIPVFGLVRR